MWHITESGTAGPFYHGTSTVFEASIREHGLGGYNPIEAMGVFDAFRALVAVADDHLSRDKKWRAERQFLADTIEQRRMWRHGATYLTPFRLRAKLHRGSELVGFTSDLYRKLRGKRLKDERLVALTGTPLERVLTSRGTALLIKVPQVPIASLKPEDDVSMEEALGRLERLVQQVGPAALSGDFLSAPEGGMILTSAIPADRLVFRPE